MMATPGSDTGRDLPVAVDIDVLERHLQVELGISVSGIELLSNKLNLMLLVSTEEDAVYLLRRPNENRRSDLFVELSEEYELLHRLEETAVPTPRPLLYTDDATITGGPFIVTTYAAGHTVTMGGELPDRFRLPASRRLVAEELIDTLAAIHTLPTDRFGPVFDRLSVDEQFDRATDRLEAATDVTARAHPELRAVGDWLREYPNPRSRTALVHGDYRPSNVVLSGDQEPAIACVIDWETALIGDPRVELGYLLLHWREEGDRLPSLDTLESRYQGDDALEAVRDMNEWGLSPFTEKAGAPSRRELVRRYETKVGASFEHDRFYRALAAYLLATVWADLDRHRVATGAEATRGAFIDYLAMVADDIASGD